MKSLRSKRFASAILALGLLAGCSTDGSDKTSDPTEAVETTETTTQAAVEVPETSETSAPDETEPSETSAAETTPGIQPDEYVEDDAFDSLAKEFIARNRESDPDAVYSFFTCADMGKYKTLLVKSDKITRLCLSGGQLVVLDENYETDPECFLWFNADEMTEIPFYFDLSADVILHSGLDGAPTFTTHLDNGYYYGQVLGFDDEGNKAFLYVGTPIYVDNAVLDTLEVGDSIGIKGYDITSKSDEGITVNDRYILSDKYTKESDRKMLMTSDEVPITTDNKLALIPVWGGCTVYGGELPDKYPDEYADFQNVEPYGSYIMRSFFFYLKITREGVQPFEGWYQVKGQVAPVSIYDGDVNAITFG